MRDSKRKPQSFIAENSDLMLRYVGMGNSDE